MMAGQPSVPYEEGMYAPAPDVLPTLTDGTPNPLANAGNGMPRRTQAAKVAAKDRQDRMQEAWTAFCGELEAPLTPQRDGADDNVQANRIAAIVNADVDFLAGLPVKIEVQPAGQGNGGGKTPGKSASPPASEDASAEDSPEQEYANQCWGDEDASMTLLSELVQNGAIFGHTFAKILTPADTGTPYCRLVPLDPRTVEVITDPDNHKVVQSYLITYPGFDKTGVPVTKRQVIERHDPDHDAAKQSDDMQSGDQDSTWTITDYTRRTAGDTAGDLDAGWVRDGAPLVWPHPFPPLVDCPNLPNANEYWGQPSVTHDLVGLQRALQRAESQTQRAIKLFADPKLWATGVRASQIDFTPGNITALHNEAAKLNVLETHADIANMRAFSDDLRSDMDEESATPGIALGRMREIPRGLSGISMRVLYQPRIMKTAKQRRLYGALMRAATQRMLAIGGQIAKPEDVQVLLHWQDPLPNDDLAMAQAAQIWSGLGVSQSTLMQQAGYHPQVEQDKSAEEAQRQLDMFSKGQGMPPTPPANEPGTPPATQHEPAAAPAAPGMPPMMHPAAVATRQNAQISAGKRPTPGGL